MPKIKVITASTRPHRFGPQISQWLLELAKEHKNTEFELIDLEDVNLPFLDEADAAMIHKYVKDHTKRWSTMIDEADGFIIVTPEYNHSYPATIKNALDFLFHEWSYKPVAFVSYGMSAGGVRAVEHLRAIAAQLKMYDLHEAVTIAEFHRHLDGNGKFMPQPHQDDAAHAMFTQLEFWAEHMKTARQKLNAI